MRTDPHFLARSLARGLALGALATGLLVSVAQAQVGVIVRDEARIGAASGGFGGSLDPVDRFGEGLAGVGDLDGDGVFDLAVGAPSDNGPGVNRGAVHVLLLEADGSVKAEVEITEGSGGFPFRLDDGACFGGSLAALGDVDGDGTPDLAVGARDQDGLGLSRGAVFVLLLKPDGSVRAGTQISEGSGGYVGSLDDFDNFGHGVAAVGDLDGDGISELAVGATGDDDAGGNTGAVTILFLDAGGAVKSQRKITEGLAGFVGPVGDGSFFGEGLSPLGDLNGDGSVDLAVGAWGDDDAADAAGAVWILFLQPDGSVLSERKITEGVGGFAGDLTANDAFGRSLDNLGDLDGDGSIELLVGATGDDDGGSRRGAAWILFLDDTGAVRVTSKISQEAGYFEGSLVNGDGFGWDVALLGDLDGDGDPEIAVGAPQDDEGGFDVGAVWILFLESGPDYSVGVHNGALSQGGDASATQRNGSGINPVVFSADNLPLLGTNWMATVDTSSLGGTGFTLAGFFFGPSSGVITPLGEVLVDPTGGLALSATAFAFGTSATYSIPVPNSPTLAGDVLVAQVLVTIGSTSTLTNALDLTLGF